MNYEIKNDEELFEFLKMKDELVYIYDELRFSSLATSYKSFDLVRKRLEYVNAAIDKYVELNERTKIVCKRDLILRPGEEEEVITNMLNDNLEDYILSFEGYIPTEGPLKVSYDKPKNGIFIRNMVNRDVYDKWDKPYHYCDSSLTRVIPPAVYKIEEKTPIGIAIPRQKVKRR